MTNNAFNNNAFTDMFKNNEMFKNADAFKSMFKGNFDMNQPIDALRRNAEAVTEACQVVAEGAQENFRAGTETLRSNVETVLKNSKDVFTSGSPEASLAKGADLLRSLYENTLANVREITEMATKVGFEAFEVLNKRASETMDEISQPAPRTSKKK
jgi:phasin family protein